jgi:hypothetical protein
METLPAAILMPTVAGTGNPRTYGNTLAQDIVTALRDGCWCINDGGSRSTECGKAELARDRNKQGDFHCFELSGQCAAYPVTRHKVQLPVWVTLQTIKGSQAQNVGYAWPIWARRSALSTNLQIPHAPEKVGG